MSTVFKSLVLLDQRQMWERILFFANRNPHQVKKLVRSPLSTLSVKNKDWLSKNALELEFHHSSLNKYIKRRNLTAPLWGHINKSLSSSDRKSHNFFSVRHLHTTQSAATKARVSINDNGENLVLEAGGHTLVLPILWLRDHCRSPQYYDHETQQKIPDFDLLTRNLSINHVKVCDAEDKLQISWSDGHCSEFLLDWLLHNFYREEPLHSTTRLLWDKHIVQEQPLPIVSHDDHMTSDEGLKQTVSNLYKFGFSIVDGAEVSEAGTRRVVERLAFVQETLFGHMWTFTADGQRSDTAYSSQALGPHTDSTYMDCPAGIQVFHCLEHTGLGGETLLVDGFRVLESLRQSHKSDFDLLAETIVPHEYREVPSPASRGYHLYSLGHVIRVHPATQELLQIRFNPYDRAPLNTVASKNLTSFYAAYSRLWHLVSQDKFQFWHKLRPGQVLFIDNWRVMHGRAAFDGKRVMCGCYLPRDDWVSKARMLGVW